MKVYAEMNLTNFVFWAGAKANAERLTYEEIEQIEEIIEELYPEGINEVSVNDLFLFSFDCVAEWLGYEYNVKKDKIIREEESE